MKFTPRFILIFASLVLALPVLRAQDEPADRPRHEGGGPGRGPGAMMEHVAKELGLSADQEAKWKEIGKEERMALKALRDDSTGDRKEMRAKVMELNKSFAEQRRAVLTPEQAAKFDEMRARMRDRGPGGPGGGDRPRKQNN